MTIEEYKSTIRLLEGNIREADLYLSNVDHVVGQRTSWLSQKSILEEGLRQAERDANPPDLLSASKAMVEYLESFGTYSNERDAEVIGNLAEAIARHEKENGK